MSKAAKAIVKHEDEAGEVVPIQPAGDAIIQMIERAARDPAVDIEKMERLFAMRERMQAQQAVAAYNTAMAAVQAELVPVVARSVNDQTKSKYAKLDAIAEAAGPIIHKHGFGTSFGTFQSKLPDHQGITVDVMHAGGHSKTFQYDVPVDGVGMKGNVNKTKTHAYGSTLTYGRRYAKLMAFDISVVTVDDDGNAAGGKPPVEHISEDQVRELNERILKTPTPAATIQIVFEHFKIENLAELTVPQFAAIDKQLREKHSV